MKITYDATVDVLHFLFSDRPVHESEEEKPGIIFDYDEQQNLIGIEVLEASRYVEDPRAIDFSDVSGTALR